LKSALNQLKPEYKDKADDIKKQINDGLAGN